MRSPLKFKWLLLLATAGTLLAQKDGADRILGVWVTPNGGSKIEIVKCGDAYCGSIQSMNKPVNDEHNPDAALRKRPLVGLRIMSGFKYEGENTWDGGTLYGPERGKQVSPKLVLTGPNSLDIKVNAGIAHKTIIWNREK